LFESINFAHAQLTLRTFLLPTSIHLRCRPPRTSCTGNQHTRINASVNPARPVFVLPNVNRTLRVPVGWRMDYCEFLIKFAYLRAGVVLYIGQCARLTWDAVRVRVAFGHHSNRVCLLAKPPGQTSSCILGDGDWILQPWLQYARVPGVLTYRSWPVFFPIYPRLLSAAQPPSSLLFPLLLYPQQYSITSVLPALDNVRSKHLTSPDLATTPSSWAHAQ